MVLSKRLLKMLHSDLAVPYHMKINGFDVAMDTPGELEAIVGHISIAPSSPSPVRSLPPIPQEPPGVAHRPPAARAASLMANAVVTSSTRPHRSQGMLPIHLKSMAAWWGCLSPKMRESVELRAAGDDNASIAKKMGKTEKSVSVMINIARRRLEAKRDSSPTVARDSSPTVARESNDDDDDGKDGDDEGSDGEDEGDDDDPDPNVEAKPEPEAKLDVEPARDFELHSPSNEKGNFVEGVGGSGLVAYLRSIRSYRILTKEEEHALATRFVETRDPKLARRLVQSNLRFVVKVALGYNKERSKLIDLIQEGNLGLMRGVEKFDPSRGMRLLTYAQHWIHAYIKIYIIRDKRLIRIGKTQADRTIFWSLNKTKNRLRTENGGVEPTNEELAEAMKVKVATVEMMSTRLAPEVALQRPVGDDDNDVQEWLADDKQRPDEITEESESLQKIRSLLSDIRLTLNPRMQHILDARLLADEPLTLEELARSYGVSRERIRQLEDRLKDKIRKRFNSTLRIVA